MKIPLNIVMTYPVRWSKFMVFRDSIQNFYDSQGYEKWYENAHYEYQNKKLTLWTEGEGFSYEWLLHIGASTKTSDSSGSAGYFGEGFKIASLCAVRDYGWEVQAFSKNWKLKVIVQEREIDQKPVQMLAYDVEETEEQPRTCLCLFPVTEGECAIFKNAMASFYYPENPILGKRLWEGREGAVYTRGKTDYPSDLPFTHDFGRKGAVFCAYQLLGSNPFDLVVCLHKWKQEDRERRALYSFDVVDVFKSIALYIDPCGAMYMLEKMRRYWNSVPKKSIDIHSWSPVVSRLIGRGSGSKEYSEAFRKKYPDLLVLQRLYTVQDKNRRGQARAWLNQQEKKYLLVQENFRVLGYPTLEEVCERQGGFTVDDDAGEWEDRGFQILEDMTAELYQGFFMMEKTPERKIICNLQASYKGMATLYRRERSANRKGVVIRYEVREIFLKRTMFRKGTFYEAVATYLHEMCHMFGGDGSNSFSQGLTYAMEILLANASTVESYRARWDENYGEDVGAPSVGR